MTEAIVAVGAAPVRAVSIPTGASGAVLGGPALLFGWSLRESTGAAAAQLDIYDGADGTGQLLATITLTAGQSTRDYPGLPGLYCARGLFVNAVAGSVAGAVWAATA